MFLDEIIRTDHEITDFMNFPSFRSFTGLILTIILVLASFCAGCGKGGKTIDIGNRHFRYEISSSGENLGFTDRHTGTDYLRHDSVSFCASVISSGRAFNATKATIKHDNLVLEFGGESLKVSLEIKRSEDFVVLKVVNIEGEIEELNFLNVPLTLSGMPDEPFAACALSMNLFTRVRELPALQSNLWAMCYSRFGIKGGEVTIIGVPQKQILPVIRNVMSEAKDIPHSDKGGAWAQLQKEGYGSYLMNFGTLTESTVGEWVDMCRSLGFNQIDNHGGSEFFRFGDFELNREKWPDGWQTYKRINDRLHSEGISSIFHTYAFFIDKNTKYVTPVPSPDLGWFSSFTLASPVGQSDNEITVNESTGDISTITGFFVRNSLSLRIGTEIIEFSGVTKTPPYKFTGCKRGANGTAVSTHPSGEKAFHLREMFGRFVPGVETALFTEIAAHTAEIVNEAGFDGIYFDAIDGSDILAGDENFWYYGTKFIFEVASRLKRPVGMEMSSMAHHWWHFRSRWQAWDRPVRGYKRFEDIHSAAIKSARLFYPRQFKSNENEHGLWRGHSPLIDKYAVAENGNLLLPLHLGWWGNQVWNPPQVEPTFPDDIEYLCCKMIGNNAGVSMLGGADKKTLDENPAFKRLIPIIKQYEELRHSNYFSDSIRALLRQPGREFTLFRDVDSVWRFRPVAYMKHKVAGTSHPSSHWPVSNEFGKQPVRLRLEALMTVKPYDDPTSRVLAGFTGMGEFQCGAAATGVSGEIKPETKSSSPTGSSAVFHAFSGTLPGEGAYLKMEKRFEPWLDLGINQGLGVWVNGDGNGELLNFRIESPKHLSSGARGDHFVKIDFKGWKYFELVEIESSEFSSYIWPDSGFYIYDSYRHTVQFNNVDKLQIWYNNLPPKKETECRISPVKALQMVSETITDPSVTINGKKITFRTKMESGMYIEFNSVDDCKLYGPKGNLIGKVKVEGEVPEITSGENESVFECKASDKMSSRVQVTTITSGEPIK
jgi:hypothetical protein